MNTINIPIKLYGKTAAQLASDNAIYEARQLVFETDTRKFKFTDGVTAYNTLPYIGVSATERDLIGMLVSGGDGTMVLHNDGTYKVVSGGGGGGGGVWGSITGTLANQTDLMAALNGKQASLGFTPENVTNKSTDGTMAANSDSLYPSQKAVRTFAEAKKAEANTYSDGLITALKDGVATPGNTLQKLYNLILGADAEDYVANIAARNAYNIPQLPFTLFVTDDGDGKWAKYQATTTGVGATFVKISDPDLLNAVMSAAAIKASYESNADTNAFTNALLTKLNAIEALADVTDAGNVGSSIHGSSAKGTPVNEDKIAIIDSAGNVLATVSLTDLKTFLKAHNDTLYQAIGTYLTASNIEDTAYNAITWNGITGNTASKNALRDEFENRLLKSSYQRTNYKVISNWTIMPDSSGNTFLEPASVKQSNDRYPGVVLVKKDSGGKTSIGFYDIVPSDYVGNAFIGIVWGSTAVTGNNAVLGVDYNSGALASTLDPSSDTESVSATVADSTTSMMGVVTELPLTSTNLTANGKIEGVIWRNSGGADNLAADIVIKTLYLKYNNY